MRPHITNAPSRQWTPSQGDSDWRTQLRIGQLERIRRQELLTPAVISMIALTLSGFLPATRPVFAPVMVIALITVILILVAALLFNRADYVRIASITYICGLLAFYAVALFVTPTGPNGQLSLSNFTAGNLYYFLADVLPIFASTLLLDMPWPILVNVIVFLMNMICIFTLPHDATFTHFVAGLGGAFFLAASVTLGQVVLIVFGIAAARAIRRALNSASRAVDLEEINRRIGERQAVLEADIRILQETHARIANGELAHANLVANSELYPVAASLNIMVDRLARLTGANQELRKIEQALNEVSTVISGMGQGDLSVRPHPTGTIVDGLLASLVQIQGQMSNWIQQIGRTLKDSRSAQGRTIELAEDLARTLRHLREVAQQSAPPLPVDANDMIGAAGASAEQLLQLLQTLDTRERHLNESIERIRIGGV